MTTLPYALGKAFCRFVCLCCVRARILHRERANLPGGYILAVSHLSHVEPALVGALMDRKVDWMSRIEFYRYHICAAVLNAIDAFPVNRTGIPVRAIRTAIARVRAGRIVGIFPEGGVAQGPSSVMRGGPIKKGACLVALRASAPIVPVVVLGTDKLTRVAPWLPFKNAPIWMIFGEPLHPPGIDPHLGRRGARDQMARDLQSRFQSLYHELRATCNLDERYVA
jgi:1-acyl-sn-glycerol-3-phosphate acyltransferase